MIWLKRLAVAGLAAAIVVVLSGLAWYYQPWSKYSPSRMANLEKPERLVENFQTMSSLIPARPVSAGADKRIFQKTPAPLPATYAFQGQQKSLQQFIEDASITGLLVYKNGRVVFEDYYQGASETSLFTSWSVAKSFVATVIAMAWQEGLIDSLDDAVEKYATQFKGSDFGKATLRELLAMSSGIDFNEDYASEKSDIRPFFFDSFILKKNPDQLLLKFNKIRPGMQQHHYISPNSHVLSAVLRGIYKKPLAQIISEKIWQPLGMQADANWLQHREGEQGIALGYCCLNATLGDYARFGVYYLDALHGRGAGADKLPKAWLDLLAMPASSGHKPGQSRYAGRGYSYHFWLPIDEPGVFFAAGVYGQYIWIDKARELVIVRTSADPDWTARYPESEAVFKAIARHY